MDAAQVSGVVYLARQPGPRGPNVSVYIKDARTQALPLVGGGEHDWAILLGERGLLPRDQAIGGAVYLIGVVLYVVAIVAGWRFAGAGSRAGSPVASRT